MHSFGYIDVPIKDQLVIKQKTVNEDNVGTVIKGTVMCGNMGHCGSVIDAMSLITHDVPSNTVVAGKPSMYEIKREYD